MDLNPQQTLAKLYNKLQKYLKNTCKYPASVISSANDFHQQVNNLYLHSIQNIDGQKESDFRDAQANFNLVFAQLVPPRNKHQQAYYIYTPTEHLKYATCRILALTLRVISEKIKDANFKPEDHQMKVIQEETIYYDLSYDSEWSLASITKIANQIITVKFDMDLGQSNVDVFAVGNYLKRIDEEKERKLDISKYINHISFLVKNEFNDRNRSIQIKESLSQISKTIITEIEKEKDKEKLKEMIFCTTYGIRQIYHSVKDHRNVVSLDDSKLIEMGEKFIPINEGLESLLLYLERVQIDGVYIMPLAILRFLSERLDQHNVDACKLLKYYGEFNNKVSTWKKYFEKKTKEHEKKAIDDFIASLEKEDQTLFEVEDENVISPFLRSILTVAKANCRDYTAQDVTVDFLQKNYGPLFWTTTHVGVDYLLTVLHNVPIFVEALKIAENHIPDAVVSLGMDVDGIVSMKAFAYDFNVNEQKAIEHFLNNASIPIETNSWILIAFLLAVAKTGDPNKSYTSPFCNHEVGIDHLKVNSKLNIAITSIAHVDNKDSTVEQFIEKYCNGAEVTREYAQKFFTENLGLLQ